MHTALRPPVRLILALLLILTILLSPLPQPLATPHAVHAAASSYTVILQQGHEGYSGAVDTYLNGWYPDKTYHGANPLVVRSDNQAEPLLRFDLSPIPSYAAITSARLELYASGRGGTSPFSLAVYRVLRPWVASEATWNQTSAGVPWGLPGANEIGVDRAGIETQVIALGDVGQWYSLDVTALAQSWLADPAANYGMILRGDSPQSMEYRFNSAEHWEVGYRPRLVVTYTYTGPTPTSTPTTTATATKTATPTHTSTATPTPTPQPRHLFSRALDNVLALDGDLSDWPYGDAVVLDWDTANGRPPVRVARGDASMMVRSMWDRENIYFSFYVLDDLVMHDGPAIWHDDGVEISLDGYRDELWNGPDDHKFVIRHDGAYVYEGQGDGKILTRRRASSDGYWLEIAIPWALLLPGMEPYSGMALGINLALHDDDDGGNYDAYLIWEGNSMTNAADFGGLSLIGDGPWYVDTYQQGLNGYYGVHDTYISEPERAQNFGAAGQLRIRFDGNPNPPPPPREKKAALLHFALPELPSGARVTRATLYLYAVERSNADLEISSYQVKRPWVDIQATWDVASDGNPWGAAGCNDPVTDIYPTRSDMRWVSDLNTWYELDVTYMVASWLTGVDANYGVVVKGWKEGSREYGFVSSDHLVDITRRPKLVIEWRHAPPTVTPTPTRTATITHTPTSSHTPTITPTPTNTATPTPSTGRIAGIIFADDNANEHQDEHEPGVAGVTIQLYRYGETQELARHVTGSDGLYAFAELAPGWYTLKVIEPPGYAATTALDWTVYVTAGLTTEVPFGLRTLFTPTVTATPSATPTITFTPTWTASPMPTATPSPTSSPSPTATATLTSTATPLPSPTGTPTLTASPTATLWWRAHIHLPLLFR